MLKPAYRGPLLVGLCAFFYAWFFTQGLPLWDDDYTSWFRTIEGKSLASLLWDWIWPVSTQPEHWGFNERPFQQLSYRFFYLISGYDSTLYYLWKNLAFTSLIVSVFVWVKRFTGEDRGAASAALLYATAPGVMASQMYYPDYAPFAESWLSWTLLGWFSLIEKTDRFQRRDTLKAIALAVVTYLGYKVKGDLKVVPVILGVLVFLFYPRHRKAFLLPFGLMLLLAIPWGGGIFSRLPPWFPGSSGSEVAWMYQPASIHRVFDFLVSPEIFNWRTMLSQAPFDLLSVYGPFLVLFLLGYGAYRELSSSHKRLDWFPPQSEWDRRLLVVLLWCGASFAVISSLPELNPTFRVRYSIMTLLPTTLLIGIFLRAPLHGGVRHPLTVIALGVLCLQVGVNLSRSVHYRRDLGQVMRATDQAYHFISVQAPRGQLALLPDFRNYDYHPDAPPIIREKRVLSRLEDVEKLEAGTFVLSWGVPISRTLELQKFLSGCEPPRVFDRLFPCPQGKGAFVLQVVNDPLRSAHALAQTGQTSRAMELYEAYLKDHPLNLGAQFEYGVFAFQVRDYGAMDRAFAQIEHYLPHMKTVLYNRALALKGLGETEGALARLHEVWEEEPKNYAVLYHLYETNKKAQREEEAQRWLKDLQTYFPDDPGVRRLSQ